MGSYDRINFQMQCPNCGAELDDFQSKDSLCEGAFISPMHVKEFYSECNCGEYVIFKRNSIDHLLIRVFPYSLDEVSRLGFKMQHYKMPAMPREPKHIMPEELQKFFDESFHEFLKEGDHVIEREWLMLKDEKPEDGQEVVIIIAGGIKKLATYHDLIIGRNAKFAYVDAKGNEKTIETIDCEPEFKWYPIPN